MGIGCFLTIVATFMQAFAPSLGVFIGGRVVIGIGQGLALSTFCVPEYMPC
jgi:predicted MFS family arabinose efflux permease